MNERYIVKDLNGSRYHRLLNYCFGRADLFIFYDRSDLPKLSDQANEFIEKLKPYIVNTYLSRNYKTGEKLFLDDTILKVFEIKCCSKSLKLVMENSASLFSWQQPDLPEDLSFEKDGRLIFHSTSHEHFFVLNVTDADLKLLDKLVPNCLLTRDEYFNLPN